MLISLSRRRAAARARDRLDLAERLHGQKRITAVQLLAAQVRAEAAKHHTWPALSVSVVGARVVATWQGDQPETEQIFLQFWRDGWNVQPSVRHFRRGRTGLYLAPGCPLIYALAMRVAGHLDGSASIQRTGLRTAAIQYGLGDVEIEVDKDGQRVSVQHTCDRTGRPVVTQMTCAFEPRNAFDRYLFVFFRGAR